MAAADFGAVESAHWDSAEQVQAYVWRQGISSMLAYDGARCVGQLYLKEYEPEFRERGGWTGHPPFADFGVAGPLGLAGRYLTLGCYHVGWMPDGRRDDSLWGRGIGTALLDAVIEWWRADGRHDGLLTWALSPASRRLLQMAGQMPHTVYARLGFTEVQRLRDPRWTRELASWVPAEQVGEASDLRVMTLTR
jgi:GNAT superfamily N-acetyltransferase